MNSVHLIGRLTKDIVLRESPKSDHKIASFTLAVDGYQKTDFIPCKAFDKTAEVLDKYTHKGSRIAVDGSISSGSYEKDGKKVYTLDVNVARIELLDKKEEVKPDTSDNQVSFAEVDDEIPF